MSEVKGGSQEELPSVQGQGQWTRGTIPGQRPGAAAGRSYPTPEARNSSREELPQVQEVVAAQAQEG